MTFHRVGVIHWHCNVHQTKTAVFFCVFINKTYHDPKLYNVLYYNLLFLQISMAFRNNEKVILFSQKSQNLNFCAFQIFNTYLYLLKGIIILFYRLDKTIIITQNTVS